MDPDEIVIRCIERIVKKARVKGRPPLRGLSFKAWSFSIHCNVKYLHVKGQASRNPTAEMRRVGDK